MTITGSVRITPFAVPVTVIVYVFGGLPPDPPPHPPRSVPANPRHRIVAIASAGRALRFVAQQAANSTTILIAYNGVGPGSRGDLEMILARVLALVWTLRVNGTGAPFTFTEFEVNLHDPALAPIPPQLSDTVPANPESAFTSSWNIAVCPAVTLALVLAPFADTIAKSVAVPCKATLCVLLGVLSWIFSNELCCPLAAGAKVTVNRQLSPAARLVPHVVDSVNGAAVFPPNPLMAITPGL